MNKLLLAVYTFLPSSIQHKLGRSSFLKPLRDFLLRGRETYKEGKVLIEREYLGYKSRFIFYSSIKNAAKAKKSGIENTLLANSFKLLNSNNIQKKDLVILDVGANFGFLSLVWSTTLCGKSGQVIAFEPNKFVYNTFKKSIAANNLNDKISLYNVAVGSKNELISIFLNNTTSNILNSQSKLKRLKVEMLTIDRFFEDNQINDCSLIKIDVDGIELDILEGSRNVLESYKPIFIVETNNDKRIVSFFESYEYEILDMKLQPFELENSLPPNIFCIPKTI